MEKIVTWVISVLAVILLTALLAVLGGTVVYLLWPVAIPAVFPGVVKAGWLAARISWWQAVTFTWVIGILFHSSAKSEKK